MEATKRTGASKIIYTTFEGTFEQARDYVVSMNLIRRHLDTGQRAMIAAELSTLSHGGDRSKPQNCGLPAKDAAKKLKVSRRSVETAKSVQKADPALAEEVKQGKTKLALAVKQTRAKTSPKSSAVAVWGSWIMLQRRVRDRVIAVLIDQKPNRLFKR